MEVLERGDVTFFFRPTVQPEDAIASPGFAGARSTPKGSGKSIETKLGVQSFFMVLGPEGGNHRRVRIGRKRLPSRSGDRFWSRVERVGSLQRVIADQLEDEHYVTKTRGERFQPGARAIGQGTYELRRHEDHVHFVYQLDHVEYDAPEELVVDDVGDYLVLFERTPRTRATWTAQGTPDRLDEEGAELVLVGHSQCSPGAGIARGTSALRGPIG